MLTREEVIKISRLARIELGDAEVEKFQKELSAVLAYVEELKEVNTENISEVFEVTGLVNVQREDVPVQTEHRQEIFDNAPETKDGYFKVKAIL